MMKMAAMKIESDIGICAGLALANETNVGIMPPRAKPIFHDNPGRSRESQS
jgi:hypothetical protein